MRFIFHLLGILFFLIWITIGAAILAGLVLLFILKPWQAFFPANVGATGSQSKGVVGSLMGSAMVSGLLPKFGSKELDEGFKSLSKGQQDCLNQELGAKTVNDALSGKVQPTPDLILKAMKCLK